MNEQVINNLASVFKMQSTELTEVLNGQKEFNFSDLWNNNEYHEGMVQFLR